MTRPTKDNELKKPPTDSEPSPGQGAEEAAQGQDAAPAPERTHSEETKKVEDEEFPV